MFDVDTTFIVAGRRGETKPKMLIACRSKMDPERRNHRFDGYMSSFHQHAHQVFGKRIAQNDPTYTSGVGRPRGSRRTCAGKRHGLFVGDQMKLSAKLPASPPSSSVGAVVQSFRHHPSSSAQVRSWMQPVTYSAVPARTEEIPACAGFLLRQLLVSNHSPRAKAPPAGTP